MPITYPRKAVQVIQDLLSKNPVSVPVAECDPVTGMTWEELKQRDYTWAELEKCGYIALSDNNTRVAVTAEGENWGKSQQTKTKEDKS